MRAWATARVSWVPKLKYLLEKVRETTPVLNTRKENIPVTNGSTREKFPLSFVAPSVNK